MPDATEIEVDKFLAQTCVDPKDPQIAEMMADLQGNILKGHGRSHTLMLFFRFSQTARLDSIRQWLLNCAQNHVTSALEQFEDTVRFRRTGQRGAVFCNLLLTHKGYVALRVAEEKIPQNSSFRDGMRKRREVLADPPTAQWEEVYQQEAGNEIHGLVLLADPDPNAITHKAQLFLNPGGCEPVIEVLMTEHGAALFNGRGQTIEHFGYVDGRSQPLFLKEDIQNEINDSGGANLWDPSAPLSLVLADDPASPNPLGFGSYFVFRKLEQNVAGFKALKEALAKRLETAGGEPAGELVGALVVGRHEDGTPVTLHPVGGPNGTITNNFNYECDPGSRCPFHAHIRKTNPRTEEARDRRIVRRGITYGQRELSGEEAGTREPPACGVGLLFMCYQADLRSQFEFIQDNWANTPSFPGENLPLGGFDHHGIDPIAGQFAGIQPVLPEKISATDLPTPSQPWPARYGSTSPAIQAPFWGFVKLLGGEYFFVPSLSGLRSLLAPGSERNPSLPET
jgi:Dyp-type peroxidase family